MTHSRKKSILIVGTFLSKHTGYTAVCEEVAANLPRVGWTVFATSEKKSRLVRLIDMVFTTWRYHKLYDIAQVDVCSGFAFVWAEIICFLLKILNKPFVFTLHGG